MLFLLIVQFELILNYYSLLIKYIELLFSDFQSALTILSFRLTDAMLTSLILILTFILILVFRNKFSFLQQKISLSPAFLILLGFVYIFAPIITNENPEYSGKLSVTKLLPPLSSVKQIEIQNSESLNEVERFLTESEKIIKPPFSDKIILADSVTQTDKIIYYQKNISNEIGKEKLAMMNGKVNVKERFYWLGTDEFGRDLFSRLIYGTRISISVGLGAVILSFIIGIILGFIAGYRGGFLDSLLNRFAETFLAFPIIYLIVLILALFGSSMYSVILVLGISGWMSLFKIVKSEVLSIKQKDFFMAAELVGLPKIHLLFKEIFPVLITPVIINLVFLFSNIILAEAALSYLGLGTGNEYPSWGAMISSGQEYITKAWWLITFPGLGLILTLFSFNSSGRKLGKKLNPRMN